jgi:hypothetical protein
MRKLAIAVALALCALAGLALACGRYGPPQRTTRPAHPTPSVPLTDPAVPR